MFPALEYFYDHLPALFLGIYKRNFETWFVYNTAKDEYPSDEILKAAKGLVIPGSPSSAHKDDEWLIKTRDWLKKFDTDYPNIRFLGVCFGEQIICHSLGGKSDAMEGRQTDPKFFIAKVEEIDVNPGFYDMKFMKKNADVLPKKVRVVEAHGDEVVELPRDFVAHGTSASCKIEFIASKNERYFGLQGHPEFSMEYFVARGTVLRTIMANQVLTKETFQEKYQQALDPLGSHEPITRKICYDFLKYSPIDG